MAFGQTLDFSRNRAFTSLAESLGVRPTARRPARRSTPRGTNPYAHFNIFENRTIPRFGGARQTTSGGYLAQRRTVGSTGGMASANAANLARYRQAMAIHNQRIAAARQMGQFNQQMISRGLAQGNAADTQNLISRGMFNTSNREAMSRGRDFDANLLRMRSREGVLQNLQNVYGDKAGFIERREDVGPDSYMQTLLALMQQLGRSGGSLAL